MNTAPRRRSHSTRGIRYAAAGLALLGAATLASCSEEESAQDSYCEAGRSLQSSLDALFDVDVIASGTSGVTDAVDTIREDLDDLRASAGDAAADEIDTFSTALSDLGDAIAAVGDQVTADNASAVVDAVGAVRTAATGVLDTLSDC